MVALSSFETPSMRPRKKDQHLPPCVYHHHGAYWLVQKGVWTRLGKTLPKDIAARVRGSQTPIAKLINAAMVTITPGLTKSTKTNYATAARRIEHAFRDFEPSQITAADVWEFRDGYAATPNMTNRCLTLLTQILNYAVRRRLIDSNPAIGVDKLDEKQRDRLLSSTEYLAIYEQAGPRLQCIMDLLYLTGQRVNDVLKLRRDALTEEGIAFKQQKTGKKLVVRWTPELKEVVDRAKALTTVPTLTLFSGRYRKAPDYGSVKRQWDDARKAAGVADAQMRDVRAMSLTEAEEQGFNPTALAGHASPAMTARYLRRKRVTKVDGPTMAKTAG